MNKLPVHTFCRDKDVGQFLKVTAENDLKGSWDSVSIQNYLKGGCLQKGNAMKYSLHCFKHAFICVQSGDESNNIQFNFNITFLGKLHWAKNCIDTFLVLVKNSSNIYFSFCPFCSAFHEETWQSENYGR